MTGGDRPGEDRPPDHTQQVADASTVLGALAWAGVVLAGVFDPVREIVALAMLVLVPLTLRLTDTPRRDGTRTWWYRAAVPGQPLLAVPGVLSLTMDPGVTAVLTALPWTVATALVGGFGAWRLLQRGPWPVAELSVDAGLVYVVVGGVALLVDRAGVSLVFEPIIVTLTVVHFHYAGSALPVLSGLAGRLAPDGRLGTVLRTTTAVIVVGPGLIAVGITAAALGVPFAGAIEFTAVAFFTAAVALFSLAVVAGVVPRLGGWSQRLLLTVASLAVTASMGFAVLYGLARATGGSYLGIHAEAFGRMVTYHGQLNAYAFALPALVGWRLDVPASRARTPGMPVSRLRAGRRVGVDFLDRRGLATETEASGMVDSLGAFADDGFDPDAVAPAVRRFFERSGEYELAVDPDWAVPWRWLASVYRLAATRVDQLSVPVAAADGEAALSGRVVGVDGPPHTGDRAWVRSNADTVSDGSAMTYLGVYDRYVGTGGTFLRVAFPLPGGNLTGVLRLLNGGADEEGVVMSSFPAQENGDDAGLYLGLWGYAVRLPLDERFLVAPGAENGTVTAIHHVETFGVRIFTLRYRIRRVAPGKGFDPDAGPDPDG